MTEEVLTTLAVEKLCERDEHRLSSETLRRWMIADGLGQSRKRKQANPTGQGARGTSQPKTASTGFSAAERAIRCETARSPSVKPLTAP